MFANSQMGGVDFAFPDAKIAVEYNGGNWHNTPQKRACDEIKTAFLRQQGWTILIFPRLAKVRQTNSGNERVPLKDLVQQVSAVVHSAIPLPVA